MPFFTIYQATQNAQMLFTMLACCLLDHAVYTQNCTMLLEVQKKKNRTRKVYAQRLWVVNMSREQKQGRNCSKEDLTSSMPLSGQSCKRKLQPLQERTLCDFR